jgi:hypothetical protein
VLSRGDYAPTRLNGDDRNNVVHVGSIGLCVWVATYREYYYQLHSAVTLFYLLTLDVYIIYIESSPTP